MKQRKQAAPLKRWGGQCVFYGMFFVGLLALGVMGSLLAKASLGEGDNAIFATPTSRPWDITEAVTSTPTAQWPSKTETPVPTNTPAPTEGVLPIATVSETAPPMSTAVPVESSLMQNEEMADQMPVKTDIHLPASTVSILLISDSTLQSKADAILLANVELETGHIKLVSFLPNAYMEIPGYGYSSLTDAYAGGGAVLLHHALTYHFGLSANGAVCIDMDTVTQMIDHMGGITITISEKERQQINQMMAEYNQAMNLAPGNGAVSAAGAQLLSGKAALCYSRIRTIDSEFQQAGRQRKLLEALLRKWKDMKPGDVMRLISQDAPSVQTNLTQELVSQVVLALSAADRMTVEELQIPINNGFHDDVANGNMILVLDMEKNAEAMRTFFK